MGWARFRMPQIINKSLSDVADSANIGDDGGLVHSLLLPRSLGARGAKGKKCGIPRD